jgi:hypothetical protein
LGRCSTFTVLGSTNVTSSVGTSGQFLKTQGTGANPGNVLEDNKMDFGHFLMVVVLVVQLPQELN